MKLQIKEMQRHCILVASALALTTGLAQASVVSWGYSTDSTFSSPTWTGSDAQSGDGTTTMSANGYELSWGCGGAGTANCRTFQNPNINDATQNRSALTVGSVPTGALTGGGPAVDGGVLVQTHTGPGSSLLPAEIGKGISLTHWNNPLSGNFETLTGAIVTDTLRLFPGSSGPSPFQDAPTLNFNFKFQETPNAGSGGVCADGLAVPASGCQDLFGFIGTLTVNLPFSYLGDNYFASILMLNPNGTVNSLGIGALSSGECGALGLDGDLVTAGNQCSGFRTAEGSATTQRFGFAVSLVPLSVPEPGSIGLLGLALVGLVVTRRRKVSQAVSRFGLMA